MRGSSESNLEQGILIIRRNSKALLNSGAETQFLPHHLRRSQLDPGFQARTVITETKVAIRSRTECPEIDIR